jgi:hypothetical protein
MRYLMSTGVRGGAVLEALTYDAEGHGFESRWRHFSLTNFLWRHCGPGFDSRL